MEIYFWFLLIVVFLFLAYNVVIKRRQAQPQYPRTGLVEMWPELANRTGLEYEPGYEDVENTFWSQRLRGPLMKMWGDYRGRYVYLARTAYSAASTDSEYVINTEVRLDVKNEALFSLDIHQKGWLSRFLGTGKLSGWNEDLDQHLSLTGWPQEYLQNASRLIGAADPSLRRWLIDYPPRIRLAQSHLTCEMGKLTDIQIQIALLDLLSDLAELAEKM